MAGRKIILLHGWGASSNKLEPLARELKKLKWSSLALKLPGFDESPPRDVWGVGDYAGYVLKRAKTKFGNRNFFVFGHSFGGRIAIKMASNDIGKLSGVVFCSASGLSRGNSVKRTVFWILAKGGKVFLIFPPVAKLWRKFLYFAAGEHDYEKTRGIMGEVFKKVIAEDLRPLLVKIKVPTLILWGKEDTLTPVADAYLAEEKIRGSKLIIFNQQGHQLPYKKTKELAEEITKWSNSLA
jgi:pimeloyl-ACP methyl ester carboxylesterase